MKSSGEILYKDNSSLRCDCLINICNTIFLNSTAKQHGIRDRKIVIEFLQNNKYDNSNGQTVFEMYMIYPYNFKRNQCLDTISFYLYSVA